MIAIICGHLVRPNRNSFKYSLYLHLQCMAPVACKEDLHCLVGFVQKKRSYAMSGRFGPARYTIKVRARWVVAGPGAAAQLCSGAHCGAGCFAGRGTLRGWRPVRHSVPVGGPLRPPAALMACPLQGTSSTDCSLSRASVAASKALVGTSGTACVPKIYVEATPY